MDDNINLNNLLQQFYSIHNDFRDCQIELVKTGHNRTIYSLTSKKGVEYIAKVGNQSKDLGSTNLNDVRVQSFLHEAGCKFIPKIIYYDIKNDIYIESCVGDNDIAFDNLTNDDIDTAAKQLVFIHKLTASQYQKFCTDNNFDKPKIISPLDSLKTSGFARFEIVKRLCPDDYVKNWIEHKLIENLSITQKIKSDPKTAHLKWGDIGENLRKDKSTLYFIDWEFSSLGYGSELAYIKIHSHLSTIKFNYLVSRYALYSGRSKDNLSTEIKLDEQITRVNDVVWAAMKWGQAKSEIDKEKYKSLTYKRIGLV